jgi:hypothetical protein
MARPKGGRKARGGARPRRPFPEGYISYSDVARVARINQTTLEKWGRSEAVYPVRDPKSGTIALMSIINHVPRIELLLKRRRKIPEDFDLVGEVEKMAAERRRKWEDFMEKR